MITKKVFDGGDRSVQTMTLMAGIAASMGELAAQD